jgi:hypothetical protein
VADTPETKTVHERLAEVMRAIRPVGKDGKAPAAAGGYAFRGIEDVMNAVHEHMAAAGLYLMPEVVRCTTDACEFSGGKAGTRILLEMRYTIYAPDGTNVSGVTVGEGMDTGDKSANKAMSAALKYFLTQALLIPTAGITIDGDGESQEVGDDYRPRGHETRKPTGPVTREAAKFTDHSDDTIEAWEKIARLCDARGIDYEQAAAKIAKIAGVPSWENVPPEVLNEQVKRIAALPEKARTKEPATRPATVTPEPMTDAEKRAAEDRERKEAGGQASAKRKQEVKDTNDDLPF